MSSDGSPAAIAGASLAPIGMPQRRASLSEPQDRLSRSVRWLSQSTRGVRRWIVGLVLAAGICFCVVLNAASDRAAAQDLRAHGQWLVSNDVQVHVAYESTRGGGFWTVDGARASFRGISGEVSPQNVGSLAPLDGESWKEGWQAPTAATGYQTPLSVIVRRDPSGALVAGMAKGDYDYRISGTTVQAVAAYIGTAALALAVLSLPLNRARLRLDARRDAHRMARITTTGRRGTTSDQALARPLETAASHDSPAARAFAVGFLVGGRVLIVTVAAAVVICRLSPPAWITAPQDAGPRRVSLDAVRVSRLTLPGPGGRHASVDPARSSAPHGDRRAVDPGAARAGGCERRRGRTPCGPRQVGDAIDSVAEDTSAS